MPVVFDQVTGTVVQEKPASDNAPEPQPASEVEMEAKLRQLLRRREQRAERLKAE